MLLNTRRRALGLILAAGAGLRLPLATRARAAEKQCFDSKAFGPWKALATDSQGGARINQIEFDNGDTCPLHADVQVATTCDAKIVLYGDPDQIKLWKKFLIDPANRLIARTADGKEAVNEPLCGNCTDIFDNKVSIVLPLATAPLFRENATIEIAVKLGDKTECHLKLDCQSLRQALDWASQRKTELAAQYADQKCTPPEGACFITTATCGVLGLDDGCFELTALRRYRDRVLAKRPGGEAEIARYYELAPLILARLSGQRKRTRLLSLYWCYILPAALAAHLGFDALAYRLYRHMVDGLVHELCPELA
jgi:hypothetical protein